MILFTCTSLATQMHYHASACWQGRRIQRLAPVWAGSAAFIWSVIGMRMNAVIGGSVLHPKGGTHMWAMLRCPEVVAAIVAGASFSVWLYRELAQAQTAQAHTLAAEAVRSTSAGVRRSTAVPAAGAVASELPQQQTDGFAPAHSPHRASAQRQQALQGGAAPSPLLLTSPRAMEVPAALTMLPLVPQPPQQPLGLTPMPPQQYSGSGGGSSLRRRRLPDGPRSARLPCQHTCQHVSVSLTLMSVLLLQL
jgi:hypothetical protein